VRSHDGLGYNSKKKKIVWEMDTESLFQAIKVFGIIPFTQIENNGLEKVPDKFSSKPPRIPDSHEYLLLEKAKADA
jgi:hypothetical protein